MDESIVSSDSSSSVSAAKASKTEGEMDARLHISLQPQWQQEIRRLGRHRGVTISFVLILLICAAAILAPWLAPYAYDA